MLLIGQSVCKTDATSTLVGKHVAPARLGDHWLPGSSLRRPRGRPGEHDEAHQWLTTNTHSASLGIQIYCIMTRCGSVICSLRCCDVHQSKCWVCSEQRT